MVSKYTIKTGNINSAVERPNQLVLKAFPLDFVKYLEIVAVSYTHLTLPTKRIV